MNVPAMNDEPCLVLHAAAQLRVELMEKSDIVPTKNKYAVMVRDYAIADVSAISLQYYHGNLTTTLTTRASIYTYIIVRFDKAQRMRTFIMATSLHCFLFEIWPLAARALRFTAS